MMGLILYSEAGHWPASFYLETNSVNKEKLSKNHGYYLEIRR